MMQFNTLNYYRIIVEKESGKHPVYCCEDALNPTALHVLLRVPCRWRRVLTNGPRCTGSTAAPQTCRLLSDSLAR